MNKTPDHLGGHLNRTNTDESLLKYVKERFKVKTHLVETATESVNFKVPRILREAL